MLTYNGFIFSLLIHVLNNIHLYTFEFYCSILPVMSSVCISGISELMQSGLNFHFFFKSEIMCCCFAVTIKCFHCRIIFPKSYQLCTYGISKCHKLPYKLCTSQHNLKVFSYQTKTEFCQFQLCSEYNIADRSSSKQGRSSASSSDDLDCKISCFNIQ